MPTHGAHTVVQTGVFSLISESGWVAQLVLLLLLALSILCWAIIFTKWKSLRLMLKQNQTFNTLFWNAKNLDEVLAQSEQLSHSSLSTVFRLGAKELKKGFPSDLTHANSSERTEFFYRALHRASTQEMAKLESHLNWLATTASAAPFIGLFGTVWGIMNAFQGIGTAGSANLAVVAPGISEALITTATGIAAAIPALIAYNYFTSQMRKLATELECFCQDLMSIMQSHLHSSPKKGS